MKKRLFLLLSVIILPMAANAFTGEAEVDGILYYIVTKGKVAEVRAKRGYSGNIVIPSEIEYDGIKCVVNSIGKQTFWNCTELTSITIPNSVKKIETSAFYGCSSLTSITIPESVVKIGDNAFWGCSGLTSLVIPNSVKEIGTHSFHGCTGLSSVSISNNIVYIAPSAFSKCTSLTSIVIPNSVTKIGDFAFKECKNLKNVSIPNSVLTIGVQAFAYCPELTEIYCYAKKVLEIDYVFENSHVEYATLYVPKTMVAAYQQTKYWKDFGTIKGI